MGIVLYKVFRQSFISCYSSPQSSSIAVTTTETMVTGPEPEDKNRKEDSQLKIDDSALKTDDDDSQNKTMILDSSALEGLRGLAALHVLFFHYLLFSLGTNEINISGSLEMPLFFLLSGFTLSLAYGKTTWTNFSNPLASSCCKSGGDNDADVTKETVFNSRKFYQNRFARIGPLYYLANILQIPLLYSWDELKLNLVMMMKILLTLTMTNCWIEIDGDKLHPFAGVSWTVTTLTFFYLVFPVILPGLQSLTSKQLGSLIVMMFHLQLLPTAIMVIHALGVRQSLELAGSLYWPTTAHPLLR